MNPPMKLSKAGFLFIASLTPCNLKAQRRLGDNKLVIGYNHVIKLGHPDEITVFKAQEYLAEDLEPFIDMVNKCVKHTLEQHQFDAVVSYAASTSSVYFRRSAIVRHINNGELKQAARSFLSRIDLYPKRREAEAQLFLGHVNMKTYQTEGQYYARTPLDNTSDAA